ncbi:TetR/AcrR family transcriptional regulator [Streptomyces sp. CSDS2]|uniref:TetR/AcrR family transcriptional regulator n=1 Tax=Streptomyces sp. CSDS2 TaxID=3055051 RepID=UPI0025AFF573|nr:TetR/AcrR family transcriptional regulator [Streptomyces sp. CSDS2]MDN3260854.1 TetR/AcrR family transcriptional regulator [Streptomyces sp. CSDS2]
MSARPEGARRRLPKGERTRARILDSATELFSRSGFNAVSLRDIAAHAGLTHAGVLHHFPGRESLLIEVLGRRDRTDAQSVFPGITHPGAPEPGPGVRLRMLVELVTRNSGTPGLVALHTKLSAEATDPGHPAHHYFKERYRVLREEVTLLVGALRAEADPPVDAHPPVDADPAVTARQLLALMDGLQTQWLLEPEAVEMEAVVRDFLLRLGLDPEGGARRGGVSA